MTLICSPMRSAANIAVRERRAGADHPALIELPLID
jgi:hypothetical protein